MAEVFGQLLEVDLARAVDDRDPEPSDLLAVDRGDVGLVGVVCESVEMKRERREPDLGIDLVVRDADLEAGHVDAKGRQLGAFSDFDVDWSRGLSVEDHAAWQEAAVLLAHIPLGLLPHIGNKIWALKGNKSRFTFLRFASVFGITLGMLGLGGTLARAVLGGRLLKEGATPNEALPALFIELFPAWLAALIGVGILAAVMSTADGLVVSSSQIVANDIYRRTLAPRFDSHLSAEQLDRRVLVISRWATLGVMIVCVTMAWMLMDMNIAILVWTGTGGMMAAFAGPLVLGALWSGVTRAGAYTGLLVGLSTFLILHTGVIDPAWFEGSFLFPVFSWLHGESPNPTSCAALAGLFAIGCTTAVSLATKPLPEAHVTSLFRRVAATK